MGLSIRGLQSPIPKWPETYPPHINYVPMSWCLQQALHSHSRLHGKSHLLALEYSSFEVLLNAYRAAAFSYRQSQRPLLRRAVQLFAVHLQICIEGRTAVRQVPISPVINGQSCPRRCTKRGKRWPSEALLRRKKRPILDM